MKDTQGVGCYEECSGGRLDGSWFFVQPPLPCPRGLTGRRPTTSSDPGPNAEQQSRTGFSAQLSNFDNEVQDFFTAVTDAVQRSTAALVSGDEAERDRMTEGIELSRGILADVEKEIDLAFAIEAPVAADLRLMITTLRVVPALERCLELARHIAERAGFADQFPADVLASFDEMGEVTAAMWEKAGTAWRNRDPDLALQLDEDDDELDVLCNELTDRLGLMEDSPMAAVEGRLIVRFYERLGDHAVHLGQRIPYLVTGHEPTPR